MVNATGNTSMTAATTPQTSPMVTAVTITNENTSQFSTVVSFRPTTKSPIIATATTTLTTITSKLNTSSPPATTSLSPPFAASSSISFTPGSDPQSTTVSARATTAAGPSGMNNSPGVGSGIIAGAAAGGVVATLVVLFVIALIIMLCCRKKKKASGKVEVVRPGLLVIDSPTNPNGNRLDQLSNLVEASSTTVSSQPPAEMEIETVPILGNGESTALATTSLPSLDTTREESGEAPVVKEYEAEVHVTEGQQAILRVEVSGKPQPMLTWSCNDKVIEPDYAFEVARDGSLCIVSVEVGHTGTYCFTAANASGSTKGQVEVKVHEEGEEWFVGRIDAPQTKPVSVGEFGEHVAALHASNNMGYYKQYQGLPSGEEGRSVEVFKMAINESKNRFRNIAVYDDNRIVLRPLPDRLSTDTDYVNAYAGDYINASYIDGYSKPKAYIACQGPLPQTIIDFWRSVWQEDISSIVMVTNVIEGNYVKCHQYWPHSGSMTYGPFTVTLAEQQMFADYIIRHLHVSLDRKGRKVIHFQFTSWPDHGVPEYAGPTLTFLRRIKAENKTAKGVTIFHCSAGVGRTGTLVSVDIALEQAAREGVVDIPSIVTRLREQRMKMVQTHDQYAFIHDAVLESLICGETQIPAQRLPQAMKQLKTISEEHGKPGYAVQFGVLYQVSPKPEEVITLTARHFPDKNRTMNYLPSELWRVPLAMEKPDYINASFANGYKQKQGYIIAQASMSSTCRDFWKMISDRRCGVIVMLSDLVEGEKEVCSQYWPNADEAATYGEFTVIASSVKEGTLTQRSFGVVHHSQPHQQHKVTQLQLKAWDGDGLCTHPQSLLELIEQVGAVQRRTGNNAIVVHGVDTVSRCGLFCALTNAVDCCKTEGIVDVFQAVKALRIQKPGSVVNIEQYQSIFELMQQFLNSFSIYSNFR